MTTRTMTIDPDTITVEGCAWGKDLPQIVICEYDNGEIVKRVRVPLRPIDIEEFAGKLWEVHAKYVKALKDMTVALRGPDSATGGP